MQGVRETRQIRMVKKIKEMDVLKMTVNVGIRYSQKLNIAGILEYGETINQFVQDAVEEKLKRFAKRGN